MSAHRALFLRLFWCPDPDRARSWGLGLRLRPCGVLVERAHPAGDLSIQLVDLRAQVLPALKRQTQHQQMFLSPVSTQALFHRLRARLDAPVAVRGEPARVAGRARFERWLR